MKRPAFSFIVTMCCFGSEFVTFHKEFTRIASFYVRNNKNDKSCCYQCWTEDVSFSEELPQILLDIGVYQQDWKKSIETANGHLKHLKYLLLGTFFIGVLVSITFQCFIVAILANSNVNTVFPRTQQNGLF